MVTKIAEHGLSGVGSDRSANRSKVVSQTSQILDEWSFDLTSFRPVSIMFFDQQIEENFGGKN